MDVCRQLTYVKEYCEGKPPGEGVSALTSEERTRWANVMEKTCYCSLLSVILLCQCVTEGTFRSPSFSKKPSHATEWHTKINRLSALLPCRPGTI